MEEADLTVVNKCDLVDGERVSRRKEALRERYRGTTLRVSARQANGLDLRLAALAAETAFPAPPQVDYDPHLEGEALPGWLNSTVYVSGLPAFDRSQFLMGMTHHIRRVPAAQGAVTAHFKMTLARGKDAPGWPR